MMNELLKKYFTAVEDASMRACGGDHVNFDYCYGSVQSFVRHLMRQVAEGARTQDLEITLKREIDVISKIG